jgi:nicotinamide riboside kinase
MKVLITGTFCSGKTTLANALCAHLAEAQLVADHCREILALFPHIDWTIPEVRDYLIVRQLILERQVCLGEVTWVIDGGIINNLAHDRALGRTADRRELIKKLGHDRYDLVFQCDYAGIDLVDDGQRYLDESLRSRVASEISNALDLLHYSDRIQLVGSQEHRLATATSHIERLKQYAYSAHP